MILTMEEFEMEWAFVKALAPFSFPLKFKCEDGITRWLLPPGNSEGCELVSMKMQ